MEYGLLVWFDDCENRPYYELMGDGSIEDALEFKKYHPDGDIIEYRYIDESELNKWTEAGGQSNGA